MINVGAGWGELEPVLQETNDMWGLEPVLQETNNMWGLEPLLQWSSDVVEITGTQKCQERIRVSSEKQAEKHAFSPHTATAVFWSQP